MGEISSEDMKKIVEEVRKSMGEALLGNSARIGNCFKCGNIGTYQCTDPGDGFECTTKFRCGPGFIRVVAQV
jgi:hypothetical protein